MWKRVFLYEVCFVLLTVFNYISFECEFGAENCPHVAWKESESNADSVTVKLHYTSASPSYVAIGFSRDDKMGQDDIYYCQRNEQNQVAIVSSYSTGMTKPVNLNQESSMTSFSSSA